MARSRALLTSPASIPPPHEPPTTRFLSPFIFITLQIPIPANALYSHPYKTPGVSPSSIAHPRFSPPPRPLLLCGLPAGARKCRVFILLRALYLYCRSLFTLPSFVFNRLRALWQKHPGWGYSVLTSALPKPAAAWANASRNSLPGLEFRFSCFDFRVSRFAFTGGGRGGRQERRRCPCGGVRRRNICDRGRPTLRCLRGFPFSAR